MKSYILTRLDQLTDLVTEFAKEIHAMTRQVHSKLDTVLARLETAAQQQAAVEAEIRELKALVLALPPGTTGSPELLDAVTRLTASADKISMHVDEIESAVTDTAAEPPAPNPASQG